MMSWIAVLAVAGSAVVAVGDDSAKVWPQFRGLGGAGIAAEGEMPPVEFGPEKNVKWKIKTPSGFSSPIVVGDKLALTAFENGKLYTIAYSRADGKELWRAEAPAKEIEQYHKSEGSPAASTPATDGERIVSYFGSCGLFCYDLAGKEQWKIEMPTVTTVGDFGTGVSPILVDGLVILLRDEKQDPKLVVIDAKTGSVVWEKKRQSTSSFATPVVWDTPEGKQIVAPGFGRLIGYDLKSGDEKWYVVGMPSCCCASPVTANGDLFFAAWSPGDPEEKDFKMPAYDDFLKQGDKDGNGELSKAESVGTHIQNFFDSNDANKDGVLTREEWDGTIKFMSASKNSAFSLKPGGSGDITMTHVLWKKSKGLPYVPSALIYADQYVMVKDGGMVTAYDAKTGDEVYMKRAVAPGRYYASPVAANGNIYFTCLDNGAVTVMKAGEKTPEIVAKNPPLGEIAASTPVIAGNTIYLRTAGHLYAFGGN